MMAIIIFSDSLKSDKHNLQKATSSNYQKHTSAQVLGSETTSQESLDLQQTEAEIKTNSEISFFIPEDFKETKILPKSVDIQNRNTSSSQLPENSLTTVSVTYPTGWLWLNSNNYMGTTNHRHPTPCAVRTRDNPEGRINYANLFNLNAFAKLSGEDFKATNTIPIKANGLVCIHDDIKDFDSGDNLEAYLDATSTIYSSSEEFDQASKAAVNIFSDNSVENDTPDKPNTTSPEYIVSSSFSDRSIENLEIPLLFDVLTNAWEYERYKYNFEGEDNLRVIHRDNNLSQNTFKINKRIYENTEQISEESREVNFDEISDSIYSGKSTLKKPIYPSIYDNPTGNPPVFEEESIVRFDWINQITNIYFRISYIYSSFSSLYPDDLYANSLSQIEDKLNNSKGESKISYEVQTAGGEIKDWVSYTKDTLYNKINLFNCDDIDRFNQSVQETQIDRSIKDELDTIIKSTDCTAPLNTKNPVSDEFYIDPMLEYLCKNGYDEGYCENELDPQETKVTYSDSEQDDLEEICEDFYDKSENQTESLASNPQADPQSQVLGSSSGGGTYLVSPIKNCPISFGFGKKYPGSGNIHPGLDCDLREGAPVHAIADGYVLYAGAVNTKTSSQYHLWHNPAGGYGNVVYIKHSDTLYSLYAHLSEVQAKTGSIVSQDDIIGLQGNVGNSTGSHLHFEMRQTLKPSSYTTTGYYDPTCLFGSSTTECNYPNIKIDSEFSESIVDDKLEEEVIEEEEKNRNLAEICAEYESSKGTYHYQTSTRDYTDELTDNPDAYTNLNYSQRVENLCPFDFDNYTLEKQYLENVIETYGEYLDNYLKYKGILSRSEEIKRQKIREERINLIYESTNDVAEKVIPTCIWFAEMGGYPETDSIGAAHGISCGVFCESRQPKNWNEELGCFLNKDGIDRSTHDYCKMTCEFDQNTPGKFLDCYGPSDTNPGFADKVARCMHYIFKVPRKTDGQCNLFPYVENKYNWIHYNLIDNAKT
jgi:murein DD-endopeptidase MepM/ murein hydrolase activator NlpD